MLKAISPIDGRYEDQTRRLSDYFSEFALMRERVRVETLYLEHLNGTGLFPRLTSEELIAITRTRDCFSLADAEEIKTIEKKINHDVKAIEYFLRERLGLKSASMIHFALTSEDVNNIAYGCLVERSLRLVYYPGIRALVERLSCSIDRYADQPFPCRTHGQFASPSTLGKEFAVVLGRLTGVAERLFRLKPSGKLNGATGTYAAAFVAFPHYDWIGFSKNFLACLGLDQTIATTQVEPDDTLGAILSTVKQLNIVLLDFAVDIWQYLAHGDLLLGMNEEEVGSSTMPHKVNPINFEKAEGNLLMANAVLSVLADRLPISRMQRDLSGSTLKRNLGVGFAHSMLAIEEITVGLSKCSLNTRRVGDLLKGHGELLGEAVQSILRREGVDRPYERLKDLSRGKQLDRKDIAAYVETLGLQPKVLKEITSLSPEGYIGLSAKICRQVLEETNRSWLAIDKHLRS